MDVRVWVIGQIVIDVFMVAVLLWFARRSSQGYRPWEEHLETVAGAEAVLSEMRRISESLEENLAQKKELSRGILEKLDQGLKRAEASYTRLSRVMEKCSALPPPEGAEKEITHRTSSIRALLEKGLSKNEIARHLGISVGEIELLLRLGPRSGSL